ncbi:uncharacterized protein LOC131320740 [Rhododendron vialii]|uniref:uncharacterized protein LOC131320740 n=1 Tax=Rhododendron vialii TaxID=182163 RepID=UPI00265FEECA|nr:uncharacterized protein LOC131320740 [Rhododendron vialii]
MDTAPSTVQQVTKASSDELLRKFAQIGDTKRRRKRTWPAAGVIDDQSAGLEGKSLLPPAVDRRSAALIRRLGMGRSRLRARGFKNRSVLGTIEKTWRNTVEGASKVFLEKHRNRHKRLINEIG